ncbi:unnamed protein product, partial [Leptidea sinapis]
MRPSGERRDRQTVHVQTCRVSERDSAGKREGVIIAKFYVILVIHRCYTLRMFGRKPLFQKPETLVNPNIDSALSIDNDSKTSVVYNRYHHLPLQTQRQKLPVFQYRNHILYLLENYQTLILIGETGCGKSTQVPQ